ncbi:MAG: hypothetical protein KKH94_11200 [Candidatus Omnitrophica bacterium]|nr:hypothetical protein [Candidatus Omnitrophota bacterium]
MYWYVFCIVDFPIFYATKWVGEQILFFIPEFVFQTIYSLSPHNIQDLPHGVKFIKTNFSILFLLFAIYGSVQYFFIGWTIATLAKIKDAKYENIIIRNIIIAGILPIVFLIIASLF